MDSHIKQKSTIPTNRAFSKEQREIMPTISAFYGILIQMYWNDHAPPHFHALYAEEEVLITLRRLT
jgi:hypothetical protein